MSTRRRALLGSSCRAALLACLVAGCATTRPEASSPFAATPSSAPYRLVVIGDSIASGGERADGPGFGVSFAAAIGALSGRSVELTTLVDPTMTTTTLLQRVMSSETWRSTIARADVITITVGGNDADPFGSYPIGTCAPGGKPAACLLAYAPALEPNLDAILAEIGKLRSGRPTAIRVTNPDFNPFIGLEPGRDLPPFAPDFGVSFYRQVADGELAVVCAVAERHGAQCVDFYHAFNGPDGTADAAPFLTSDHLHPSKVGQDRIAELLGAAGLAPLLPDAT